MTAFTQEQLLEEGEIVHESIRKHWIVYVYIFFLHAFGCLIFLISAFYLAMTDNFSGLLQDGAAYGAMTLIAFVLIFWTSFFYAWTREYFDVWHVTNMRIIAISQKEIFTRDEAFMELSRIQDVFFEKDGFLSTVLGYGKLRVQSAGTLQEFVIEDIQDVEAVAHRLMDARDEVQGKKGSAQGL